MQAGICMACMDEVLLDYEVELPDYAELHCVSNFSFQRGASRPEELVERAKLLGYKSLAITDECSMAGVVRAHMEAKDQSLHLIIGTQLKIDCYESSFNLILLARNRKGYGQLCELITHARSTSRQRDYAADMTLLREASLHPDNVVAIVAPYRDAFTTASFESIYASVKRTQKLFDGRCWLAVELLHRMDDDLWFHKLREVSRLSGIALVASGDVHMHVRSRKPLQDVMTSIRVGRPVHECGLDLKPNAQTHLRSRAQLARMYPEELLKASVDIAAMCTFNLAELKYEYPQEVVPAGQTPASYLRQCVYEGAEKFFPNGTDDTVTIQIEKELQLIADLGYEKYFLTVYDLVRFARSKDILCQGRGSAANSVVCFCLGITAVDPIRGNMLFERFISKERNEPPDIDVDFEHQRREEVIQYLYEKYGRHRAALTATVVTYRPRSAIRDVGKALGMDEEVLGAFATSHQWWDGGQVMDERLKEVGLDPKSIQVQLLMELTGQLMGFPRHLSQHSGGFVLTGDRLTSTVPVRNAAMDARTIIEWDKDDIDALGLLKVDVLALGMLSALQRSFKFIGARHGYEFNMHDIPPEDPATFDMICKADTVGVFQIESRAQQSMLPRLQPRCYYDLVVEVAIVRPGPIQGGMVHPYLTRREEMRAGHKFESQYPALKPALDRTLGIPIFQEQVMQIAIIAAKFSPGEADALRRSMAAWRRSGGIDKFKRRLIDAMIANGYEEEFSEAIFRQIEGFGEYGFPESHAASFALLVYQSAWMKCHEPECFLAAMLNSLPMGFYGPSQLIQDAQRHGVKVEPADVMWSDWDCTLEGDMSRPTVRLGFRLVSSMREASFKRIHEARSVAPFTSTDDLALRAELDARDMNALASADALKSLSGHRRQQVWESSALHLAPPLLREAPVDEEFLELEAANEGEEVVFDYASTGLTLRSHPLALLRETLTQKRLMTSGQLYDLPDGRLVRTCGLVVTRQQPGTAKGVMFMTLEDEEGSINVIVWKSLKEKQRIPLLNSRLLAIYGVWQRKGEVRHLVAQHAIDMTHLLGRLNVSSRDFR